jgi:threonine dehydrogenase-like Zn-dependent dehydrogenase
VVVYEPNPVRQEVARKLGFEVLNPLVEKEMSVHTDFDSVLECSGVAGSTKTSLKILRSGGTAVLVGFRPGDESFELLEFILSEKHLVGTAAHMWDVDVSAAVGLLANKIVDTSPLLTDVISLADVPTKGFDRLISDKNVFKIAVNPSL